MSSANIVRTSLIAGLALIAVSSTIQAGTEVDDKESLALRKIMQDMGDNMQSITDGISREDWKLVEKNAALVAEHPQPPLGEKIRILSFIGSDVSKFKGYD
ncbi:MAG: cytochrome C, partial [Gammaproteobacteria bacterium]|nr:cytochrome C [Gammaproteobacteria bacterium]